MTSKPALFIKANLNRVAKVGPMSERSVGHLGRLDFAINNASISPGQLPVDQIDEENRDG